MVQKSGNHFYFGGIFRKCTPILTIFHW